MVQSNKFNEKLAEDLSMDIDAVIDAIGSSQKPDNVQLSNFSSSGGTGGGRADTSSSGGSSWNNRDISLEIPDTSIVSNL